MKLFFEEEKSDAPNNCFIDIKNDDKDTLFLEDESNLAFSFLLLSFCLHLKITARKIILQTEKKS